MKREREVLILVMSYFFFLMFVQIRAKDPPPPPPSFTPLFVHCCVQDCSYYLWYFTRKLDVNRVVSIGFLNEEFYIFFFGVP